MTIKFPVPESILVEITNLEDNPNYINKKQLAKLLGCAPSTLNNWGDSKKEPIPIPDLIIGKKLYWLPITLEDFVLNYRKNNNKPLA